MPDSPAAPPAPGRDEPPVVDLFLEVMGLMRDHVSSRIAEFDLTPPLAMALRSLDEPAPQRELAEVLRCDPSHVTGVVDRLEQRDLVERRVDPGDRRVKNVVLTPAGRELRAALETRLHEDAPVVDRLSAEERRTLHDLLSRIVQPPAR